MFEIRTGGVDAGQIRINEKELAMRLGCSPRWDKPVYAQCEEALRAAASCRYAYIRVELSCGEPGVLDLGSFSICSRDLWKNLENCSEAWIFGVTLGPGVDRLLRRLRLKSEAEHFITDAFASAMVEALTDRVDEMIREEALKEARGTESADGSEPSFRPRYSPGYGDCGIENQKAVLQLLEGVKTLGISLNENFFMSPVKSVTAIIGVIK